MVLQIIEIIPCYLCKMRFMGGPQGIRDDQVKPICIGFDGDAGIAGPDDFDRLLEGIPVSGGTGGW
jgi:hypothetical protein